MIIIQLSVKGMSCASCVNHVEKSILKTNGVERASVNLATEEATVSYDPSHTKPEEIIKNVEKAGYAASIKGNKEEGEKERLKELSQLRALTILSSLLSLPLALAMGGSILAIQPLLFLHNPLLQLILATPVQFGMGLRFYRGAWQSLKAGSPSMDVLVALGTSAAYALSIYNGFFVPFVDGHSKSLYFEASAVIITLMLLGRFLEGRAKGKTSEAIKKLMGLQAKMAQVEREGEVEEIPINDVVPGDLVHIKPGDRIPVDGVILKGHSAVDESTITGESLPVEKTKGDSLISGSLNSYGSLVYEAKQAARDSVLARIIAVVEEAQSSKAPIQKLADKVAAVFVPVVLVIALGTFLVWWLALGAFNQGVLAAVAVLVIACPCALGLATPTAITVGSGVGAQRGILIKNGESLQRAGKVNTVVLDKTGTITRGKPQVVGLSAFSEKSPDELLTIAASLEQSSEHPLAQAVVRAAKEKKLPLQEPTRFTAFPGKGVEGTLADKTYFIGTQGFLEERGLKLSQGEGEKTTLEEEGKTVVLLGDAQGVLALIAIADTIKEHSVEGIQLLRDMGMDVYMITGDNGRTARSIAANAGVDRVLAEVLPEKKASEVKKLQEQGQRVAMVGDGVNDAPALATADIGIAMGEGSDIAIESSDITLMRGDLREVGAAIQLSRKTMTKIKQNLFWAFFYNSLGIPIAAAGLLDPIIAGGAMAFSSFSVVSNSLNLKKFKVTGMGPSQRRVKNNPKKTRQQ